MTSEEANSILSLFKYPRTYVRTHSGAVELQAIQLFLQLKKYPQMPTEYKNCYMVIMKRKRTVELSMSNFLFIAQITVAVAQESTASSH